MSSDAIRGISIPYLLSEGVLLRVQVLSEVVLLHVSSIGGSSTSRPQVLSEVFLFPYLLSEVVLLHVHGCYQRFVSSGAIRGSSTSCPQLRSY